MSLPYIAQAGEHQVLEWTDGIPLEILLDGDASGGQLTVVRSQMKAGSASPLHLHRKEDEVFLVLSGSGTFWVGEDCLEIGAGGIAFLPRNLEHAYRFEEPAEVLTLCTPSGMEHFFRAAGRDMSGPRPEDWSITIESLVAAAAAGGQEILGPPPTRA